MWILSWLCEYFSNMLADIPLITWASPHTCKPCVRPTLQQQLQHIWSHFVCIYLSVAIRIRMSWNASLRLLYCCSAFNKTLFGADVTMQKISGWLITCSDLEVLQLLLSRHSEWGQSFSLFSPKVYEHRWFTQFNHVLLLKNIIHIQNDVRSYLSQQLEQKGCTGTQHFDLR